jgi:hypothetical protein
MRTSKRPYNKFSSLEPQDYQHPSEKPPKELSVPPGTHLQDQSLLPKSTLLEMHGIKPKYLINEWMKIVNQDDDLTNKRRALEPLMREIGINTTPDESQSKVTNNIIVMPAEITKKFGLDSTPEPIINDIKDIS